MSNKFYNPFGMGGWTHHELIPGDHHRYLGPCPKCGTATFDYGGGWRCFNYNCYNSSNNPTPNVGPKPDWWNKNINVKKDGNSWCAYYDGFINLQESESGWGETPNDAVMNLVQSALNEKT